MISANFPEEAKRAAAHCEELLSCADAPTDFAGEFDRLAARLVEAAGPAIAALCDVRDVSVAAEGIERLAASDVIAKAAPGSLHAFHTFDADCGGILVSTSVSDLVAQFERILGGTGEIEEEYEVLPASAARFAHQFDSRIAQILSTAFDRDNFRILANGSEASEVSRLDASDPVWTATLSVEPKGCVQPWKLQLAVAEKALAKISGAHVTKPGTTKTIGERGVAGSAIADVELPVRAVLVDMAVSLSRISQLVPGATIPVAIHRNVPVLIGDTPIGLGSVGEVDDRVALEMTQTSISKEF